MPGPGQKTNPSSYTANAETNQFHYSFQLQAVILRSQLHTSA